MDHAQRPAISGFDQLSLSLSSSPLFLSLSLSLLCPCMCLWTIDLSWFLATSWQKLPPVKVEPRNGTAEYAPGWNDPRPLWPIDNHLCRLYTLSFDSLLDVLSSLYHFPLPFPYLRQPAAPPFLLFFPPPPPAPLSNPLAVSSPTGLLRQVERSSIAP